MENWCEKYPEFSAYLNFCAYSPLEIGLVLVGTIFWALAYGIIILESGKKQFVEMPAAAAAANIAWEFVWGFLFVTDLGLVFVWGLRIWFFLDIFIVYRLFKYGFKQVNTPFLVQNFKFLLAISILAWGILFYFFIQEGYDTSMGATSAYIITPPMSFLYLVLFSFVHNAKLFSYQTAWYKMIGSGFMLIFVFLHYPKLHFLQTLALISLWLDVWYIYIFHKQKDKKCSNNS